MGCGSSKNAVVPSVGSSQAWSGERKPASAGSNKSRGGSTKLIRVKSGEGKGRTTVTELKLDRTASRGSLGSDTGRDGGQHRHGVSSATSKASAHTTDSGLEADCYGNIITEESDPTLQEKVQLADRPQTPDLSLSGTQITTRKRSGKQRTDEDIIGELQNQGLLTKPMAGHGGMMFDVMIAPEFGMLKRPPPRLAKLKKRKTKKQALTKEELEAKLIAAEERRKKKKAEKIGKLDTVGKEKQVQESLDATEEQQKKEVAERSANDMSRVSENREARLKAQREKQERRKAHAEKVRQARLARQAEGAPTQETVTEDGVVEGVSGSS